MTAIKIVKVTANKLATWKKIRVASREIVESGFFVSRFAGGFYYGSSDITTTTDY